MPCPSCGHENRDAARFCEQCGTTLASACPNCGAELRPSARFCDSCGHRLTSGTTENAETTRRGVQLNALSDPSSPSASSAASPEAHNVRREPVEGRTADPTSFASDRYTVKRFLGEGGKKRVYLAHDTLLDRDVAFALIKTEVLFPRFRVSGEALQAPP